MWRYEIFGIVGPLTGFLAFMELGGGFGHQSVESFFILLLIAMIAGLVPAVVTAAFDGFFERLGGRKHERYILIALVGYAASYLLALENLFEPTPMVPSNYSWGLIGAIPAVLCSWLNVVSADLSPPR